jgi:hypothetical protein
MIRTQMGNTIDQKMVAVARDGYHLCRKLGTRLSRHADEEKYLSLPRTEL